MRAFGIAKPIVVLAAMAAVGAGLIACDFDEVVAPRIESTLVQTASFTVAGVPSVDVESANGAVRLRGVAGQTDIQVRATLHSRGMTLEEADRRVGGIVVHMEQEGDRVVLHYIANEQSADVRRHSEVEFDVTQPIVGDIHVQTANGEIVVVAVQGLVDLDTSNGRISVRDFVAEITAETSNGEIVVERGEGVVRLDTANGRIQVQDVIALIDAETSNGAISFQGELMPGSHRLSTTNGRITVRVPAGASIRFIARTNNAPISSSLPLVGDTSGGSWDAILNPPATATLDVRTSNGSIDIGPSL